MGINRGLSPLGGSALTIWDPDDLRRLAFVGDLLTKTSCVILLFAGCDGGCVEARFGA